MTTEEMTPVTRCLSHVSMDTQRGSTREVTRDDNDNNDGLEVLKECNNALVSFIEKARVLSEAQEIRDMYPQSL